MMFNCLMHGLSNGDKCLHCHPDARPPFPTGVVPRLNPATLRPYAPDHPVDGTRTLPDFGVHGAAIQQAVDDYILMERKARAWDEMREEVLRWAIGRDRDLVLELMGKLVHLAPTSSTR